MGFVCLSGVRGCRVASIMFNIRFMPLSLCLPDDIINCGIVAYRPRSFVGEVSDTYKGTVVLVAPIAIPAMKRADIKCFAVGE